MRKLPPRLLLAGLLYLPFLSKPLHIDDPYFVAMSDQLGWNPLAAQLADQLYMGRQLEGLSPYELTHPIGILWTLKATRNLFGESEVALHLAFLVFPLLALFGLARLTRALVGDERARDLWLPLAAFFLLAPQLLVASHGLMTDYPTLALLLFGCGMLLDGARPGGTRAARIAGSLGLTAAAFFSYQALFLPVLLLVFAPAPRRLAVRLGAAVPLITTAVFLAAVHHIHGTLPLVASSLLGSGTGVTADVARGLPTAALIRKALATLAAIGLAGLFPLSFWAITRAKRTRWLALFAALLMAARLLVPTLPLAPSPAVPRLGAPALEGAGAWQLAFWLAAGLCAALAALHGARAMIRAGRRREALFALTWIAAVFGYCTLLMPFGAPRYSAPLLAPLLLLLLYPVRAATPTLAAAARWRLVPVTLATLLALGVSLADLQLARAYQTAPQRARESMQARGASNEAQLYFVGEWGLRHYAVASGAHYLLADSTEPRDGDFILAPTICRFWTPSRDVGRRLTLAETWDAPPGLPLHTFNPWSGAGLYGDSVGLLPISLSTAPLESFSLFRVGATALLPPR